MKKVKIPNPKFQDPNSKDKNTFTFFLGSWNLKLGTWNFLQNIN